MARSNWTVKGRLLLEPQLPEVKALLAPGCEALPLAGVRVLVEAKEFGMDPTWDNWGEDVTDSAGRFSIDKTKDGSGRMFRVRVMFKDDELKIYPESKSLVSECLAKMKSAGVAPIASLAAEGAEAAAEEVLGWFSRLAYDVDWLTILEDQPKEDKRKQDSAGDVNLGDLVFGRGRDADRGDEYGRRHAEIWLVVKRAMKFLKGIGFGFREGRTIALKHPHSTTLVGDAIEASYFDPFNNVGFIIRNSEHDDFDFGTMIHEVCHGWMYQHSTGETSLASQLLLHGSTHTGRMKKSFTGFHEAIAEVISNEISRREFNTTSDIYGGRDAENRPLSRPEMRRIGIASEKDIEFFEDGWLSAFGLLLCDNVCSLDMQTQQRDSEGARIAYAGDLATPPKSCTAPRLALEDLLRAIASGSDGRDDGLDRDDMTLLRFLNRLAATSEAFESKHVAAYLRMLDPSETKQPWEILAEQKPGTVRPPSKGPQQPKPRSMRRRAGRAGAGAGPVHPRA